MQKIIGLVPDSEDRRDFEAENILTVKEKDLPDSISYRSQMTPVRNQGQMGSCAAFAVIAVKEWEEHLFPQRMPAEDLSELDLYRETKERDPYDGQGTSLRCVLKVAKKLGITDERACPYTDRQFPVQRETVWWGWGKVRDWEKIGNYHRLRTKEQMKRWLVEHGPFVLGIPVGSEIHNPEPPEYVVPAPTKVIGGHAIAIVGYDKEGRLEFKNSWSSNWGNGGYAKLATDYLDKIDWFSAWGFLPASVKNQEK